MGFPQVATATLPPLSLQPASVAALKATPGYSADADLLVDKQLFPRWSALSRLSRAVAETLWAAVIRTPSPAGSPRPCVLASSMGAPPHSAVLAGWLFHPVVGSPRRVRLCPSRPASSRRRRWRGLLHHRGLTPNGPCSRLCSASRRTMLFLLKALP